MDGGGMAGSIEKWAGGATAHGATILGELGPAAKAQRQEFKKARNRLATNDYSEQARVQKEAASGQQAAAGVAAQQQADVARMQAGGLIAGGQVAEAQRAIAQTQQAATAQAYGQAQENQNARAQQQHAMDQGRVDQQAAIWRDMNKRQADISMQTTGAANGGASTGAPKWNDAQKGTLAKVQG